MTDVRIITESLGGSTLSLLMQRGEAPPHWSPARPAAAEQWKARARAVAEERSWSSILETLAPAFAATGEALGRLERVRTEGGVVVTTGQQPGLFGGPVYTWSKAMSALALADEIERVSGVPTAAVFWAATDDADFAEASSTVVSRAGGADVLRDTSAPAAGTPMSMAPLGDVAPLLARLRDACGSIADPRALEQVEAAYTARPATVGSSYVALLRVLLEPFGMPVLDASHDAVREASREMLRSALHQSADVESALRARDAELHALGFTPQVETMKGLSLVFARRGAIKERVSAAASASVLGREDAHLTPNVLLRPVVERCILPTVAYVGGPGEIAYFAQVSAVASSLGAPQPLVAPRWSCTLVERAIEDLLRRFGMTIEQLADPHALEGSAARDAMAEESVFALDEARRVVDALATGVGAEAGPLGLSGAVQGAVQSLQHRIDRLERRLVAGIKRREHAMLRDVATLRAALYPAGIRQERAMNLIPLVSRHGLGLLDEMRAAAAVHARALVIGS